MKILPGVRMNLGKRGISTSIGGKFGGITFGPSGVRRRVSLPGTGLSYTEKVGGSTTTHAARSAGAGAGNAGGCCALRLLGMAVVGIVVLVALVSLCNLFTPNKGAATGTPTPPAASVATTPTDGPSPLEPVDLTATARPARMVSAPITITQPIPTGRPTAAGASTVAPTNTAAPSPTPAAAASTGANLRGGPGTNYPIVGQVMPSIGTPERHDLALRRSRCMLTCR